MNRLTRGAAFAALSCCVFAFAAAPAAAAEPRSGGTLSYVAPYGASVSTLDLHRTARVQDAIIGSAVHCTLFAWDGKAGKPLPDLAQDVKLSADGKTVTIKLRSDAKFQNGRGVTADDVVWSLNRIATPATASPAVKYVTIIDGAQAVVEGKSPQIAGLKKLDAYTVQMTLTGRHDPSFNFAQPFTAILPKEEVEARGDKFATNPVGCGPFKVVEWVDGSRVVVERNPNYFRKGLPYLDRIVFNVMADASARDLAFRSKSLDFNVLGGAQYDIYQADPALAAQLMTTAEAYTRYVGFNASFKPFSDKRVRQAFNYAIDSDLIIRKLAKNKAYRANGWLPIGVPGYDKNLAGYAYDPAKAKALLKDAGYPDGFTVEVVSTNNESYGAPILEALIPFLAKVGITLKPKVVDAAVLQKTIFDATSFQAFSWSSESGPNPLVSLGRFRSDTPHTAGNYVEFKNAGFDALLDKAAAAGTDSDRADALKQANAVLTEEAPLWFFNYNKAVVSFQPWVHGLETNPAEMALQPFASLWVDDKSPRAEKVPVK